MREICVSTDVFALIWSLRRLGEDNEDEILRRVLRSSAERRTSVPDQATAELVDRRNGVSFPAGFEIYRTYKGNEYRARATRKGWQLVGSAHVYKSLNALNREIVDGSENAWRGWYFTDEAGQGKLVGELREKSNVSQRRTRISGERPHLGESGMIWRNTVVEALRNLGGRASLDAIYQEVKGIRSKHGLSRPRSLDAIVRRELEHNSSDSQSFLGRHDLFYSVHGVGLGVWGLKETT